jgi:hypothetical protein
VRKSIPLTPDEDSTLRRLYLVLRIPSDQYKRRPREAASFLATWNHLTSRSDEWDELLHYIITKRKAHKWVTFGDEYEKLADPGWSILSDREWFHLEQAYAAVVLNKDTGSDSLLYDQDLSAELARDFAKRSGRSVAGTVLTGLIVSKRKRGEWLHLKPGRKDEGDLGFSDINEVA